MPGTAGGRFVWQLVTGGSGGPAGTVLVVDMANVVGSVPDGWWRDRVGAAQRLLTALGALHGRTVDGPDGSPTRLVRLLAVLEGAANRARTPMQGDPGGLVEIIRATGSGDDEIAALVTGLGAAGDRVLVVTADRGLRARMPPEAACAGPGWLNALVDRA